MKQSFESLSKRLGALDKERREVITALKKSPEYAIQHLKQVLNGFIVDGAKKWYSRTNGTGQLAYFKLLSFEIIPTTTTIKKGYTKTKVVAPVDITKNNSVLTNIKLKWDVYNYGAVIKSEVTEDISISIFNDVEAQILNGRKEVAKFNEKQLIAAALLEKKKGLEDQLKKIKAEIASIVIK